MNREASEALIGRLRDALNARDLEAAASCLQEDVSIEFAGSGDPSFPIGLADLFSVILRHFDGEIGDLVVMSDATGIHGAARFTLRGRYRATLEGFPAASGQAISVAGGAFFEIDDGLLSRITLHFSKAGFVNQLAR